MKWFNCHRVPVDQQQRMINAHIKRGYDLHHVRGLSSRKGAGGDEVYVTFVIDLTEDDWAHKWATAEARYQVAKPAMPSQSHVIKTPTLDEIANAQP